MEEVLSDSTDMEWTRQSVVQEHPNKNDVACLEGYWCTIPGASPGRLGQWDAQSPPSEGGTIMAQCNVDWVSDLTNILLGHGTSLLWRERNQN